MITDYFKVSILGKLLGFEIKASKRLLLLLVWLPRATYRNYNTVTRRTASRLYIYTLDKMENNKTVTAVKTVNKT